MNNFPPKLLALTSGGQLFAQGEVPGTGRDDAAGYVINPKIHEPLPFARVGIVQINPLRSSSTSCEGINDTTALEKTITATVAMTFTLR